MGQFYVPQISGDSHQDPCQIVTFPSRQLRQCAVDALASVFQRLYEPLGFGKNEVRHVWWLVESLEN